MATALPLLSPLDMGGNKIGNAAPGTASADLATLGQLALLMPSGDTSGVADAAAISAAATAGKKRIWLSSSAPWYIECGQVVINASGVYINAAGCVINAVGTGDMLRMYDSSPYESRTVHGGGLTGFPVIDGTLTTGSAAAWHAGDIFQLRTQALIQNFTEPGSHGILFDNQWAIAEQMNVDTWVSNCSTCIEWTQTPAAGSTFCFGSFERCKMNLRINHGNPAFAVFKFSDGVYFGGSNIEVSGNASGQAGGSALTTAMFYATGTSPEGSQDGAGSVSSNLADSNIFCNIELADNNGTPWTHTPTTFKVDGDCFFGNLTGRLDFGQAGPNFTPTSAIVGFYGETDGGDPAIISQTVQPQLFQGLVAAGTYAGAASLASNGTISTSASWAIVAPTAGVTGVIVAPGTLDGQLLVILNGSSFTITMAAAGTSNVSGGTSEVIPASSARQYWWSVNAGLWYPAAASGTSGGGTLTGYIAPHTVALTFGTTIAVNAALGNSFNLTLTASTGTIANPTNPVDGQAVKFRITQDGTGSRTVSWGTAYDFGTAGAPTLTTTAGKTDIVGFEYVAALSKWCYLGASQGF